MHRSDMRAGKLIGLAAVLACTAPPKTKPEQSASSSLDSLVLERTACYGLCPIYRLRISSADEIRFESRNPADSGRVATDIAPAGTYASLVSRARAAGFFELPAEIAQDPALCRLRATDHPSVVTAIFSGEKTTRVEDYRGCYETSDQTISPRLRRLRAFEDEIDSVLRTDRWTKASR